MSFSVTWSSDAEQTLAEAWLNFPNREAVSSAARTIDELLQSDPLGIGESRSEDVRFLFVSPLAVFYEASRVERQVVVLTLRLVARRRM